MIKRIAILTINSYQAVVSSILKNILGTNKFCRFEETCSEFTKRNIAEKGLLKGSWIGLVRLLKCQPFYSAK